MSSYDRALAWLSYREHSERELRRKLKLKEIPEEEHDALVERLKRENLLNDARFFDLRCRALLNRKQGRSRILSDLRQRGVEWNELRFHELEEELHGSDGSAQVLDELIEKKMRESRLQKRLQSSDREDRQKLEQSLLRSLIQKGHSAGESFKAIRYWLTRNSKK
jgi:regulatory protein